jgi:hypothetical protein
LLWNKPQEYSPNVSDEAKADANEPLNDGESVLVDMKEFVTEFNDENLC